MASVVQPRSRISGSTAKLAAWRTFDLTSLTTHIALFTAICLQRFGVPFGPATLSISLPVFILLALWLVLKKRVYVTARSALFFGLFFAWSILAVLCAIVAPDPRVGFSMFSYLEVLALYIPMLATPRGEFDSYKVQRIFIFYVRLCAVMGLAQFVLQFAHIRLFSISEHFPSLGPWLLERDFATISPTQYGSAILRSNGLFLLEPSIFSQILALGVLVDYFVLGRKRWLLVYAIAYLVTFSGTGLLSLILTLGIVGLSSPQNAGRVAMLGLAGVVAVIILALVAPSLFAHFAGRANELQSTQTSGYARYVAPLAELKSFGGETRLLVGYGPGATSRNAMFTGGSGSAALQLIIDYGAIGAVLFACFIVAAVWRNRYAALSIMLLVMYQFGGGYLLNPPTILLMAVLGIWGTQTSAPVQAAQQAALPRWRMRTGRFAGSSAGRAFSQRTG